jgi:hypothetical protein
MPIGFTSLAPFGISDDQWKEIETLCGFAIPTDLRSAVVAKTQTMRWLSEAWQSALPLNETVRQIAGMKRTTVDWLKWTDGLPPEIEDMIMSVDNSDPPVIEDMIISVDNSEQVELVIKPFMKRIVVSCDERLSDLASIEGKDRPPWETWIVELTDLFKQYGLQLPTAARKDVDKNKTGPSPFVIFIRELQQLIEPPQYRRHTHSDEALADAINNARNPRNTQSIPGEQPRQDEQAESDQAAFGGRTEDPPSE